MNVTTRARYSLRAVIDIARNQGPGPVRAADVAERQRVSQGYLERILNQLVESGIVESRKGPGGGFLLARPAKDITVKQVFNASGEELLTAPCLYDACEEECPLVATCPARDVWSGLRNVADGYLESRTLAEFTDPPFRAEGKKNGLRPLRSSAGSQ